MAKQVLSADSAQRKATPIARGVLDYFPSALAAVAALSQAGNDKHNPGEELHHARGKSTDHADCIVRHLIDRGTVDVEDGIRHSVKVAWRALALLQEELEREEGASLPRGAKVLYEEPPRWIVNTGELPSIWLGGRVEVEFEDGTKATDTVGNFFWSRNVVRLDNIKKYRIL